MANKVNRKSLFFLGKKDAKNGEIWSGLSDDRKFRQHPHGISETDAHAIPKYSAPIYPQDVNPNEAEFVMDELEAKIKALKQAEPQPRQEPPQEKEETKPEEKDRYLEDWNE